METLIVFIDAEGCPAILCSLRHVPTDGFTQASVESSQMSSTRGTADVSFPGADTAVKQLDGGM